MSVSYIGSTDTLYILNKLKNVLDNGYVAKESGKGLSTNDLTDALLTDITNNTTKLANIHEGANKTSASQVITSGTKIATITIDDTPIDIYAPAGLSVDSEMSDTSENAVQNKVIKKYVDDAIGGVTSIEFVIVDALPETGESGKIYLVPNSGSGTNTKDEYVWIPSESRFEKIGSTDIDLTPYLKIADIVEISTDDIDDMFDAVWP